MPEFPTHELAPHNKYNLLLSRKIKLSSALAFPSNSLLLFSKHLLDVGVGAAVDNDPGERLGLVDGALCSSGYLVELVGSRRMPHSSISMHKYHDVVLSDSFYFIPRSSLAGPHSARGEDK